MNWLSAGLDALQLDVTAGIEAQLLAYLEKLQAWNQVMNLSASMTLEQMISHHLLDSLSIIPYVVGTRILDVGTGAGLPGLPLAVVNPDWRVTLLDSRSKRTCFLRQVVHDCGISNVEVVTGRVQSFTPAIGFDSIVSRAFCDWVQLVDLTRRLGLPGGKILSMQGKRPMVSSLPTGLGAVSVVIHRLEVPYLQADRHLVEVVLKG